MPVQVLFLDEVHEVNSVRYEWSEDGLVLLTLDCYSRQKERSATLTFEELRKQIGALCSWQQSMEVIVGTKHALSEVLTLYHAFEAADDLDSTLMLVSTPPDEYFEAAQAA